MNPVQDPRPFSAAVRRAALLAALVVAGGCAKYKNRINELTRENQKLRGVNEALEAELAARASGSDYDFAPIRRFTVGVAAAEQDFDSGAFETLLQQSLDASAGKAKPALTAETSDRELAKIRGMLVQQYLAAEEVPIVISNLSYRLADAKHDFKIGGTVVPRDAAQVTSAGDGGAVGTLRDELPAVLRREGDDTFRIDYEESGQGRSSVEVRLTDLDMIASADGTRAARQGDVSFNWRLNLAEVRVYEVEQYRGDVGTFLRQMRVNGARGELSQFQTLQDTVFLFGYGPYRTDVVSQLRTPAFIDRVEVAAIDPAVVDALTVEDDEEKLLGTIGADVQWVVCESVDFERRERTWRRPIAIGFPFVSRQTSTDRGEVFYSLYTAAGTRLLGNFSR